MPAKDLEMSDVIVVADELAAHNLDELTGQLKAAGVAIESVDRDNGVIEGTVQTAKLKTLESLPTVKYVRSVFRYVAEENDGDGDGDEIPR